MIGTVEGTGYSKATEERIAFLEGAVLPELDGPVEVSPGVSVEDLPKYRKALLAEAKAGHGPRTRNGVLQGDIRELTAFILKLDYRKELEGARSPQEVARASEAIAGRKEWIGEAGLGELRQVRARKLAEFRTDHQVG